MPFSEKWHCRRDRISDSSIFANTDVRVIPLWLLVSRVSFPPPLYIGGIIPILRDSGMHSSSMIALHNCKIQFGSVGLPYHALPGPHHVLQLCRVSAFLIQNQSPQAQMGYPGGHLHC